MHDPQFNSFMTQCYLNGKVLAVPLKLALIEKVASAFIDAFCRLKWCYITSTLVSSFASECKLYTIEDCLFLML